MNIPNLLTILRALLAVVIVYLLIIEPVYYAYFLALVLFFIGIYTDYLDGRIARKTKTVSDFGKITDPISDKLLILLTLFAFSFLRIINFWLVAIIALREIIITALRIRHLIKGRVLAAKKEGKYKTASQMFVILLIFIMMNLFYVRQKPMPTSISVFLNCLMLIVVIITLYSGLIYLKDFRKQS